MIAAPNYPGPTDIPGAKPITLEVKQLCDWTENDEGGWDTGCGNTFYFIDGTPHDNGFRYCCFCGKTLLQNTPEPTP